MTRPNNLQKLQRLRHARLQRAENALARQHAECEAAHELSNAATAQVVAYRDWQQQHERVLLDGLLGRAATISDIERIRATFTLHDEHRADLECAEREARQAMRAALKLKDAMASERNRLQRDHHKILSVISHAARVAHSRAELYAEAEQEEHIRRASNAGDL